MTPGTCAPSGVARYLLAWSFNEARIAELPGTSPHGPANQYQTLGLFMYQQGWQFGQLGRAATVAWVMFLLIVVLVLVNARIARRRGV